MESAKSPSQYAQEHQRAFRCAFDFLTAHFPPGDNEEWWEKTAQEASETSESHGDDHLTMGLLIAVYNYLEAEYTKRRDNSGTED